MKITSRQLRQIIREELLREEQTTAGTTSAEVTEDSLMKALKSAAAVGHQGVVRTTGEEGEIAIFSAVGDGRNFQASSSIKYEDFLDKYIKPARRAAYDEAFKKLAEKGDGDLLKRHIRVPLEDINPGAASDYLLMGIERRDTQTNLDGSTTFTISNVGDRRRYSVKEIYDFLNDFIKTPIKVYDAAEGEDKLRLIYPAAEREKVEVPTLDPKIAAWVEKTSKTPLRQGAKGDDVVTAQKLLVTELKKASSSAMGTKGAAFTALQNLLAQKKIEGGKDEPAQLTKSLAEKIEASGPDGIFGPMTYVAVQVFQDYARLSRVDGVIGKDTANALARSVERVSLADQPEQAPEAPPTESEAGDVNESHVIARWNKLAGLIKS